MSFDQLLFAGEFQTREFKINFETDRLLANLGQSAINKLLSNLLELGKKFFLLHAKHAGCFSSRLLSYA
ncbi:hypothetical protein NTGBS_160026 [Candidatus Nitrotoga sp. BS]|uniref:hypothetical protein n=1 Tax=Candidatus Nitrotoga sp. BS TaxID=2890408 RepID=UPI001EF1AD79|nr:hypothetical protein [Candidatus Nitrotoga sp. BS]CAH1192932.1 hypothetical protein NTGBS_160026 [Candidatus Nitrotoga sp. BS]